jgi:uncharacterized cupin superfamily protein
MAADEHPHPPEAPLEPTPAGLRPAADGWYVVNATEAVWEALPGMGRGTDFGPPKERPDFAVNISVLAPGEPNSMYHAEEAQEGFLVLSGECLLLVEGEERRLRQWDFVHCPPWTRHVFVGAGDGECVVLMIGGRAKDGLVYPADELAQQHRAGVRETVTTPREAYADWPGLADEPYRPGTLDSLG